MNKNNFNAISLEKGEMHVYDFGGIKLHAYRTDDFINDEVFIVEKNGKSVIIESPCFFDNNATLEKYVAKMNVVGMLIAYHDAGGSFLPNVEKYATQNAKEYGEQGGGKALIDNFANVFGKIFDKSLHKITNIIDNGKVTIGGIDFIITKTHEAYNIAIPEINAVYTHMLGHDCHSIVAGAGHADAIIAELNGYISKGYGLILTSHYTPEDLKDAQTKIDYLNQLKDVASKCKSAEEFKQEVKERFPNYAGDNYLDMTAGMFFA
ncbi:MAG: hypothetical protein K2L52_03150 [Clostridia bacterium]|nr:hypothetical protein [Clostridia bacterium]